MNLLSKFKATKSKSVPNLAAKRSKSRLSSFPSFRIVSPNSSTSSENNNLSEVVTQSELRLARMELSYDSDEAIADSQAVAIETDPDENKENENENENVDLVEPDPEVEKTTSQIPSELINKMSKKQLKFKLEDIYAEKHELIKEFTNIINIKDLELDKLKNQYNNLFSDYSNDKLVLESDALSLKQELQTSKKYTEYLELIVSDDSKVLLAAQNDIFLCGDYLTKLLNDPFLAKEFEANVKSAKLDLKIYLESSSDSKFEATPVNCKLIVTLLERVGQEFLHYDTKINNQSKTLSNLVNLICSLNYGLRFILTPQASSNLESLTEILSTTNVLSPNIQNSPEYFELIKQIAEEIDDYNNGHKQLVKLVGRKRKEKNRREEDW